VKLAGVNVSGVPGEWSIVPGSDASRVLMFFHGGGYCSGSILSHRRMVTEAGRAAGIRTLAIGYRLAPEHPFPAAFDDALTAWHFVREQGIAAAHIAIGGDSAGGALAHLPEHQQFRQEPGSCATASVLTPPPAPPDRYHEVQRGHLPACMHAQQSRHND